jgi:hypothetical protein
MQTHRYIQTLIFDSCHSASGSRNDPNLDARLSGRLSRGAEVVVEIPYDIDDDLISGSRGPARLLHTDQASHVLLAACGSLEKAWEENGRGVFTAALIKTMQGYSVDKITYQNLIAAMPMLSE